MKHKARPAQRHGQRHPFGAAIGACSVCGKKQFRTRQEAKAAARFLPEDGRGPASEYACGDFWHVGHLPSVVKRGVISRSQINGEEMVMAGAAMKIPTPRDLSTRVAVNRPPRVEAGEPGLVPEETCIMDVSPDLAAAWLLRNERNRSVRESAVTAI